jgi:peptidoglycan L-alanyl-D-glutamate endopeptidase CwlK
MSMAKLGQASETKLMDCTADMQRLMRAVVERLPPPYDLTILVGHRGQAEQDAAFASGNSEKRWPDSMHNQLPSKACDISLYPVDWSDKIGFGWLAGFVFAVAVELGLAQRLRWGGDFNRNGKANDDHFSDLDHFELRD